jgi:site-specific DNA recombinase
MKPRRAMKLVPPEKKRCAIYTRTGVVAGGGRVRVSIDAQRAACLRYIRQHPDWAVIDQRYDDQGKSGANTDRPALQRLLTQVEALRVDIVVVHEVDRLSRWYLDFATIVERLRAAGAEFVSVAHKVSTADPIGKLAMKMLMSFAGLEREARDRRLAVVAANSLRPDTRASHEGRRAASTASADRPQLVCSLQALPTDDREGSS